MRVPFISYVRSRRSDRPMSCAEVGKLLQRYLDGHLDAPRGARLHAHLEDCRRCGLEADTYERIKTSLGGDAFPVPEDSLTRLREFGDRLVRGDEPIGL